MAMLKNKRVPLVVVSSAFHEAVPLGKLFHEKSRSTAVFIVVCGMIYYYTYTSMGFTT